MWGMEAGNWSTGVAADSPYMALFNASRHALKAVHPSLVVGGPATACLSQPCGGGGQSGGLADFLRGLDAWGIDADFISTHSYPTDACNTAPDARTRLDCFTDGIVAARQAVPRHPFLITEFNCGWKNGDIHDGESKAYAASFLFRTVGALLLHDVAALSWWTFSSLFEEPGLPTHEFGPFGANAAMQTVHGVPLPVYRGFQLLADAGDVVLPVTTAAAAAAPGGGGGGGGGGGSSGAPFDVPFDQSGPLTAVATLNSSARTLHVFLSNFAPDDGRGADPPGGGGSSGGGGGGGSDGTCFKMKPNPCTEQSCFLAHTDFPGGDLLPEAQKFTTPNASACCAACLAFLPDQFCQAWSWRGAGTKDPRRCYLKGSARGKAARRDDMTAGYPTGVAPPSGDRPYYETSRVVSLTLVRPEVAAAGGRGAGAAGMALVRTINSTCANPKAVWAGVMDSVTWPSAAQLATLRAASQLCEQRVALQWSAAGTATIEVALEAYAAVAVTVPLV